MQVIVNYPDNEETMKTFNNKFALFHATLLLERIKKIEITVDDKIKLLSNILIKLNNNK